MVRRHNPSDGDAPIIEIKFLPSGLPVVSVRGELRVSHTELLTRAFQHQEARQQVLDLTDCTFLDSGALGTIVGIHKMGKEVGHLLAVIVPKGRAREQLEISRLNRVLNLYDNLDDFTTAVAVDGDSADSDGRSPKPSTDA
ncbi:MAG: STAS domain-containing protein [bacterium]